MNEDWKESKSNIALHRLSLNETRSKMSEQLRSFVEFHGIVKKFSYSAWHQFVNVLSFLIFFFIQFWRLAEDFSSFLQPVCMMSFIWSLVTICGVMLLIQMEIVQFILNYLCIQFHIDSIFMNFNLFDLVAAKWTQLVFYFGDVQWSILFIWFAIHYVWTWPTGEWFIQRHRR